VFEQWRWGRVGGMGLVEERNVALGREILVRKEGV